MKFLYIILFFIIFIISSFYYTYSGKKLITNSKAKNLINNNKIDYIIDVRTKFEWNLGHYKNKNVKVINIPINNINYLNITKNIPNNNSYIIVYCNTGQRARLAVNKLNKLGYNNVYYISSTYKFLY